MPSVTPILSHNKVKDLNISYKENLTEGVSRSCFPFSDFKTKQTLDENDPIGNANSLRLRGGGEVETETEDEDFAYEMEVDESISEENLRTVLLEAGYNIREVEDIIAGKERAFDSASFAHPGETGTESEDESAMKASATF